MVSASQGIVAPVNIVLIEDDALLREFLSQLIAKTFFPRELRGFGTGELGLAYCVQRPPELLITDLLLPDGDGREFVRRLWAHGVRPKIVILTGHADPLLPAELLRMGVEGYVDKCSPPESVMQAIRRALNGGFYFSSSTPPMPILPRAEAAKTGMEVLTEREREIARRVAEGAFSKEIGMELGLSARTVEKLRLRIMDKVGAKNLPGLVRWCVLQGLV